MVGEGLFDLSRECTKSSCGRREDFAGPLEEPRLFGGAALCLLRTGQPPATVPQT
jgi:hypothetical protein